MDLLTPPVLVHVNEIVTREGLPVSGKSPGTSVGRPGRFVRGQNNVHHPTDLSLLLDGNDSMSPRLRSRLRRRSNDSWLRGVSMVVFIVGSYSTTCLNG